VGHAGLVPEERGQVHGLGGVILGETLHLTPVASTPLAGKEAQGSVSRGRKLAVRLGSKDEVNTWSVYELAVKHGLLTSLN